MTTRLYRDNSAPSMHSSVNAPGEDRSKARERIDAQIAEFQAKGGRIDKVEPSERTTKTPQELYRKNLPLSKT